MDKVELNYEQVLSFTELKQKYIKKNGQKAIVRKLTNMGMCNINRSGEGINVIYRFEIPDNFWKLLQVPNVGYQEIENHLDILTEVMDMLLGGTVRSDGIVEFQSVIIDRISSKYNKDYKAVEFQANKFKKHFNSCGLLIIGEKSHRVKFNGYEKWITGKKAIERNLEIKKMWREFFEEHFAFYKTTKFYKITDHSVPKHLIKEHIIEFTQIIIRYFSLDAYKVAKSVSASDTLLDDIKWSRATFLASLDMDMVRAEITKRQNNYKEGINALVKPKTVADTNKEFRARKEYLKLYKESSREFKEKDSQLIKANSSVHLLFANEHNSQTEQTPDSNIRLEELI